MWWIGRKIRTWYLLPKVVSQLKQYRQEFQDNAPFHGICALFPEHRGPGKMSQTAIN
jgi:hypothetical protein